MPGPLQVAGTDIAYVSGPEQTVAAGEMHAALMFGAYPAFTVDTLRVWTGPTANTATSVWLGLYSYEFVGTEHPKNLLASVLVTGTPAANSYVEGSFAPVECDDSTPLFLVVLPLGGTLHYLKTLGSGGFAIPTQSGASALENPWDTAGDGSVAGGPLAAVAYGSESVPGGGSESPYRSQLKCKLTTLHYPEITEGEEAPADAVPSRTLALLLDATDIEFYHPLNDSREASCTIHFEDPAAQFVEPYATMLHVTLAQPQGDDVLVFWGILTQPEWNSESQTIRINAVDPSLRLKHHYLRHGDEALNSPTHPDLPNFYDRQVPVGLTGLNMLINAGENTEEQTARGVPDLGILNDVVEDPAPDFDTADKVRFQRGQEVWAAILELTSLEGAPDFELQPIDDLDGYYCQLLTGVDLNADWTDPPYPAFQDSFGKANCRINYRPGTRIVTHSHIVSEDYNLRVTAADVAASRAAGVYVDWDAAQFDGGDSIANAASLLAKARRPIGAYGAPVEAFDIIPNLDCDLRYFTTFVPGSYVRAQARWKYKTIDALCRVVSCRLRQVDAAANVQTEIEVTYSSGNTAAESGDDT